MRRALLIGFAAAVVWQISPSARQISAGPPPAPPATGAILGQVVDGESGQPISDATVTVAVRGGRGGGPTVPSASQVRLLTGADGKFVARDVPVGNVQLSVTARGYVNGGFGQARPGGATLPFVMSAGTAVNQVRIRLWRTAAITGRVIDEFGEPLPGIDVRAMRRTYVRGQSRFVAASPAAVPGGRSDDRGVYRISGLTPGDYVVVSPQTQMSMPAGLMETAMRGVATGDAQALMAVGLDAALSGGAMLQSGLRVGDQLVGTGAGQMPVPQREGGWRVFSTRFYPGTTVAAQAATIALGPGDERTGVDLAMPLVATATISGVVMGPAGPMGNVGVRVRPKGESLIQDSAVDVAAATTRPDGTFTLVAVPKGDYVIRVLRNARPQVPAAQLAMMPEELKGMLGMMAGQNPLDAVTLFAEQAIALERDVAGITLNLTTGATVAGRVEFEGASGPMGGEGMMVSLTSIGGEWSSAAMLAPSTGGQVTPDNTFVTAGYPPGRYAVTVGGRLIQGWSLKSVTVNGREGAFEAFELGDRPIADVVVRLTNRQSTLTGTVQPAAGGDGSASVVVFPVAWREWIAGGMAAQLVRLVRTPANGNFSIGGLTARDYYVVAVDNASAPDVQDPALFEALARVATTVTLPEGDTRTVALTVMGGLR